MYHHLRNLVKLADVIGELVEERGMEKESLGAVVCEGMLAAYQRKYPDLALKVEEDSVTGDLVVLAQKIVVATVDDEYSQISLKKEKKNNTKIWKEKKKKIEKIIIYKKENFFLFLFVFLRKISLYSSSKVATTI